MSANSNLARNVALGVILVISVSVVFTAMVLDVSRRTQAASGVTATLETSPAEVLSLTLTVDDGEEIWSFNGSSPGPTIKVKAVQQVSLTLKNTGTTIHDIVIPDLDVYVAQTAPGASNAAVFIPREPGVYEYFCSLPGHKELGMHGQIIVE